MRDVRELRDDPEAYHHGRYRDVFVPVGDEWLIRHRYVSTDWRSPGSTMARDDPSPSVTPPP